MTDTAVRARTGSRKSTLPAFKPATVSNEVRADAHIEGFNLDTVSGRVAYLVWKRQMTQTMLAERCGITQSAIANIISGGKKPYDPNRPLRRPSGPTILALARELETTPEWIVEGQGDPWQEPDAIPDSQEVAELKKAFLRLDPDTRRTYLKQVQQLAELMAKR